MAKSPPWIQPIALAYDSLAPGKSRLVMRVGRKFRADTDLCRREFDAKLRRTIFAVATITPSHLLARFLLHGPATFTSSDLSNWLERTRAALAKAGTPLDPLFERIPADRLAGRRLRWLCNKGLVAREGETFRNICRREVPPSWRRPENAVRYLDNTLTDFVPGIEQLSTC